MDLGAKWMGKYENTLWRSYMKGRIVTKWMDEWSSCKRDPSTVCYKYQIYFWIRRQLSPAIVPQQKDPIQSKILIWLNPEL